MRPVSAPIRRSAPVAAAAPFLLAAWACGGADATARWEGSMDTLPGGAVHVQNPAEGVWSDTERWTLTESLRIGALESEGPDMFGQVRDLEVDPAGRIWVLESQAKELRVFDADGAHVRTVARAGEGPGELNFPAGLHVLPDGSMAVLDIGNSRFEVFDTAGTRLRAHPLGGVFAFSGLVDPEGRWVSAVSRRVDGETQRTWARFRMGEAGLEATGDTFPWPAVGESRTVERTMSSGGNSISMRMPIPFAHNPDVSLTRSGRLVVDEGGGAYRFRIQELSGDTVLIVERTYEPLPVTREEIDEVLGRDQPGSGRDLSEGDIPEMRPPLSEVHVAEDGTFWVERSLGPDEGALDVFDPRGRYLGAASTDVDLSRLTIHRITADEIHGVLRDELDVPYVVRLAIARPGA